MGSRLSAVIIKLTRRLKGGMGEGGIIRGEIRGDGLKGYPYCISPNLKTYIRISKQYLPQLHYETITEVETHSRMFSKTGIFADFL
jgi:hypothetical protein